MSNTIITLPSSGFTKTGYTLTGWQINGQNYQLGAEYDLTADATAYAIWTKDPESETETQSYSGTSNDMVEITYRSPGATGMEIPVYSNVKAVYLLNNVVKLGVNSLGIMNQTMQASLISAYLSDNIVELYDKCFQNCSYLEGISVGLNLSSVGDRAFQGCNRLTYVDFLENGDTANLWNIGDYAFEGTQLTSVKLRVKSSVSDSSIGAYSFANCPSLQNFEFMDSPYLGDHMFYNCTNLSSITLTNKHSYVGPYCFANCMALSSMEMPNNMYMLADHMFDGCLELTSLEFDKDNSILMQLGQAVFRECNNLTALALPASVSSFTFIDPIFLSGSSIQRLSCYGISASEFTDDLDKLGSPLLSVVYIDSAGNEHICTNSNIRKNCKYAVDRTTTSDFKYGVWYRNARELKAFVDENHIPCLVERSSTACDPCINFKHTTWQVDAFQDQIQSKKCMLCRVEIEGDESFNDTGSLAYFISHEWCQPNTYIPELLYYWKKDDTYTLEDSRLSDWNYNYRTNAANSNYQTVLSETDRLFADYISSDAFNAPERVWSENRQYCYYIPQTNDTNGRYFIFDSKEQVYSLEVSFKIGTTDFLKIAVGDDMSEYLTAGNVYMFYINESDSVYKDQHAIIFYVGSSGTVEYLYNCYNTVESEPVDSELYPTGEVISMDDNSEYSDFKTLVQYAGNINASRERLLICIETDSSTNSDDFRNNVISSDEFNDFCENTLGDDCIIVSIKSLNGWAAGAPAAAKIFEEANYSELTANLPRTLLCYGCASCKLLNVTYDEMNIADWKSVIEFTSSQLNVDSYIQLLTEQYENWQNYVNSSGSNELDESDESDESDE